MPGNPERATPENLHMKLNGDAKTVELATAALRDYLRIFAAPADSDSIAAHTDCLGCGKPQGGFLGHFTYGIVHGEGRCAECGWPARANHYVKVGESEIAFQVVLQYHPDEVTGEGQANAS